VDECHSDLGIHATGIWEILFGKEIGADPVAALDSHDMPTSFDGMNLYYFLLLFLFLPDGFILLSFSLLLSFLAHPWKLLQNLILQNLDVFLECIRKHGDGYDIRDAANTFASIRKPILKRQVI
jgi:hypothetical protein